MRTQQSTPVAVDPLGRRDRWIRVLGGLLVLVALVVGVAAVAVGADVHDRPVVIIAPGPSTAATDLGGWTPEKATAL